MKFHLLVQSSVAGGAGKAVCGAPLIDFAPRSFFWDDKHACHECVAKRREQIEESRRRWKKFEALRLETVVPVAVDVDAGIHIAPKKLRRRSEVGR